MKRTFVLVAVAAALLGSTVPVQAVERPNVVMIVADDLGWRDVGWHDSDIRTPNLDKLAAEGVRLERHYVFPTCSPTRCALLAGRNPSRFGILGPIGGRSELALPLGTATLPSLLKERGYTTAIAGKWHLGLQPKVGPKQYGFLHTYGYLHGQIDPYTHLYKNGDRTWHRNDVFLEEQGHATDLLAADAVRFLSEERKSPFFLYVAFSVPHTPLNEEEKWTKPYEGKIAEPSRRQFAASVTHMDDAIGQIVAALEKSGRRKDTLIVFTSDNGGQQGSNKPDPDYGGRYGPSPVLGNNVPLRGWKGEVYEGGIRVPAVACWPGTLPSRSLELPISALDWLPTIAGLAGCDVKPEMRLEGQNVWGQLAGKAEAGPRTLYWKTGRQFGVRVGDWKLIETGGNKSRTELFNLAEDPLEKTDLAAGRPEQVERLRSVLREQRALDPR